MVKTNATYLFAMIIKFGLFIFDLETRCKTQITVECISPYYSAAP